MIYRSLVLVAVGCGGHPAPPTRVESKPDVPQERTQAPPARSNPDIVALKNLDDTDPRSIDRAIKAADALGDRPVAEALAALGDLARRPVTKKLIAAQIAAIRALGKYDGAAGMLAELVDRDSPARPTGGDRSQEESYGLYLGITGASINALGELHPASAVPALVHAMYRTPELFVQVRRALVAIGPAAQSELRSALRGENAGVNKLFAAKKLDVYCGSSGCTPVSARDFYPAIVLGDLHDAAAVPDLLAGLSRPAAPVYFIDDTPSPTTQHGAIYDALRKLGAPEVAGPARATWSNKHGDLPSRILAVSVYPFVTRDDVGVEELGTIAADNTADDELRQEAATAFARLAHDAKDIAKLDALAKKYFDASAKKRKEADGKPKAAAEAAERVFADEKARGGDLTTAKRMHKDAVLPFKQLDSAAKAYKAYARMFQSHFARIEVAIRCKDDLVCYGATLSLTPAQSATNLAPYIKDLADWTDDEKLGLLEGEVERAMLELGKRGAKAVAQTDVLLAAVASDDRLIRQSVLLALPRIAKLPCDSCVTKLDAAIRADDGKSTLADLTIETTLVRNYFAWAGK